MNAFAALGVAEDLTALLKLQGIKMPTPIQQASIPSIFKGKDLIGRSQTGTGKTLAYLLPVIQRVDKDRGATQVLIMTPTRELSKQVFDVFRPFALKLGLDGVDIIGGRTIENQLQKAGYTGLAGKYIPTAKNLPVAQLYEKLGYEIVEQTQDGVKNYAIDLAKRPKRVYYANIV